MSTVSAQLPPNAPYVITVGEPIEVKVFENEQGLIVAEVEYGGDRFGQSIDPDDLGQQPLAFAIDEMVGWAGMFVWNELGGTPVFREEDADFTGRMEVQAPWLSQRRMPTAGLIENHEALDSQPEVEAEPESAPRRAREQEPEQIEVAMAEALGVRFSADEVADMLIGKVPLSVQTRVVKVMPTLGLLGMVEDCLSAESPPEHEQERALMAVRELRERLS